MLDQPVTSEISLKRGDSSMQLVDDVRKPTKRLRVTPTEIDACSSLEALLRAALPDKEAFFPAWLKVLSDPSICITSLEDVKRLGSEDIASLPVPPLVKGLFREVINRQVAKAAEQQVALELTSARARAFLAPLRDRNNQPPLAGSKYFQDHKNYKLILTKEEIDAGVRIVTHKLETWCKGERIVLVGILKGAFMFMSDLCRAMTRPYSVFFVEASSYKEGRTQGSLSVSSDISSSKFVDAATKKPHKVVIVDELLDNGKTMQDMKLHFLEKLKGSHTDADILTVCLFSKQRARTEPEADITGIPGLPDLWLVGYGLDDRGTKRGWTELFAVPKVKLLSTIEEDEVTKLLGAIDDDGVLKRPHVFSDFELPFKDKCRYRVKGLDTQGEHETSRTMLKGGDNQVKSKADVQRALAELHVVKGKYEREVQFAFIAENASLVSEYEIFYGNNQVYAKMRCDLRKQIETTARRLRVVGLHKDLPGLSGGGA
jgi:hypoxanthine phosphoribosyltransferase